MHLRCALASGSLLYLLSIHHGDMAQGKEGPFAVSSGVGFNWLDPETARCARISTADGHGFRSCEFRQSGAFGLPHAYHACATDDGAEFLVFESLPQCEDALATMYANAP